MNRIISLLLISIFACLSAFSQPTDCDDVTLYEFGAFGCSDVGVYDLNFLLLENEFPTDLVDIYVNGELLYEDYFYANFDYEPIAITNSNQDADLIAFCATDGSCCVDTLLQVPNCDCNVINEIILTETICEPDGQYYVIDLDYIENGSEFFDLSIGSFQWSAIQFFRYEYSDLPVTIGPIEPYILNNNINIGINDGLGICSDFKGFEYEACTPSDECSIVNIVPMSPFCNGETFNVNISVSQLNEGTEWYTVLVNGEDFGDYSYFNTLSLIGPLPADGETGFEIEVIDNQFPECTNSVYLPPVSCPLDNCFITQFVADAGACNANGEFMVTLDLNSFNPSSSGFSVVGNGTNYGTFAYTDLPVQVGPLVGDGTTVYEFIATDGENEACTNWTTIQPVGCENSEDCQIVDLWVEPLGCNPNGTYIANIFFEAVNANNAFFDLWVNNEFVDFFPLSNLPLTTDEITPRPDTDYDIVKICINDNPDCCLEFEYLHPNCENTSDCGIDIDWYEIQPCDANGEFYIQLAVSPANDTQTSFMVLGNGNEYGTFDYGSSFVTVGPLPQGFVLEFVAVDVSDDTCQAVVEIEAVECDASEDCAFNVEIDQQSCSAYALFTPGEEPLDWYVNDEFQLTGLGYDFTATNAGTYQICVVNEGCPAETNFCETFVVSQDCFGNCAVGITINEIDCDTYEISESSGQQVSWYINDEFVSFFHGHDFDPTEAGTYEICAGIETPDCPQGVFVCETIVVSSDCFEDACAFNVEIDQQSCSAYALFSPGEEPLDWYVNDEFQLTGLGYDFTATNAGTYEICVVNEGCPPETNFCETFVVSQDCFGNCAVGITINEIDCDTYEISESSGQQVSWYINDEFVSFFHGHDFDPTEAGTYEICAGIETPDCPQGVFVCETIVVSSDCFEDACAFNVEIDQQSCSAYALFSPGEEPLDWYVNDEFQLTGLGYDFTATNAGTYQICVVNEGCPPETNFCETFVVSQDCFGNCAVGITINEIDCDTYEISESSGQQVSWYINDEFVSFFHGHDFDPTEAGTYEICAGIETPDCPQGVFVCETIVVSSDCFEDACAFNVEIDQQSCSAYALFSPGEEPLDWYVNDEFQLTGLGYDFTATNAGTYQICVVNEGCPPETNFCETFVVTEDCFENDCKLSNLMIEHTSCENGTYTVVVQDLALNNPTSEFVQVWINNTYHGIANAVFPLTYDGITPRPDSDYDIIKICINDNFDCCVEMEYLKEDCPAPEPLDNCIGFESLETGTVFDESNTTIGEQVININNITATFEEFTYVDGSTDALSVEVQAPQTWLPEIQGNALWVGNTTLLFDFTNVGMAVNKVHIDYYDLGGEENLSVNGESIQVVNDFTELPVAIAPGVSLTNHIFVGTYPLTGTLIFEGIIETIQIGGQEFFIDNLCYNTTNNLTGDVWPGDANYDNITNNFDLLNLGLAHGFTGAEREGVNIEWFSMPADEWADEFENGINYKHADCNGNGVVDDGDITAVFANYGKTHGETFAFEELEGTFLDPPFYVELPAANEFVEGDMVEFPIILGSADIPVDEIYGIAFTLNFTPGVFESLELTFANGLFGGGEEVMNLTKGEAANGQVEIAITRKDQLNIDGNGIVAWGIGIIDDVAGLGQIEMDIIDVKAIKADETLVPLYTPNAVVDLSTSIAQLDNKAFLNVFPNPASTDLHINSTYPESIQTLRVLNLLGQEMLSIQQAANQSTLDVSQLLTGIYFLEVQYEMQKTYVKFEVMSQK